jgi:hypothetical protein
MIDPTRANFELPRIEASAPGCRACVVIPARDEADRLGAALGALARQVDAEGRPLPRSSFEVIVLANNCRDGTAALARRFAASNPTLVLHVAEVQFPRQFAHVGTARKMLMDAACRRLMGLGRDRGVIASTDADTRVGPNWLAETFAEFDAGADAVGGDIRTDRAGRASLGHAARQAYLLDVAYRRLVDELEARVDPDPADPWPRHHHHTGASLAVAAGAYASVGGLPPLPSSEDVALVAALRRAGFVLRHGPRVRVVTSARRIGRAAGGMADTLRRWSADGPTFLVEHPDATEARARWRAESRGLRTSAGVGFVETFGHPDLAPTEVSHAIALLKRRLAALRRLAPVSGRLEEVESVGLLATPAQVA